MLERLQTAKLDNTVISLRDDDDVRYWASAFGVTERQLQKLANEHGASPRIIRAFLNITRNLPKIQRRKLG